MSRRRLLRAAAFAAAVSGLAGPARAGLPEVIATAKPSVLPIGTFDALASPRFRFRGTAFVVGNGRYAVTNVHVVAGAAAARLALQVPQGEGRFDWRMAEVVQQDRAHDLALLRFDGAPLPALPLGAAAGVREGHAVALIGFPIGGVLGFQPVTHRGVVAAIAEIALPAANAAELNDRALIQLRRGSFEIYQLDATAYPGNSGGPVLDAETGEVLAVINMVLTKGGRESALAHPSGISYAIPVRFLHPMVEAYAR